ncbi:hypothetical protein NST81_01910 [Bacillus sp. FSL W8-0223]|jgi:methionine synthase I (cobalamin-dependent)|uniref:hypothetical protein n=1 Tax=Bacillus sp. FSL W8-0223 TaxID=2954595 RepID=UPI0030F765DE
MIVHNKGKYIRHIGVRLVPGANSLNQEDGEAFLKESEHPLNKVLLESGEISYEIKGLSELSAQKAATLVKDTFDLKLLEEWKEKETRKTILKAIDEQIESIKNPPAEKIVDLNE